MFHRTIAPHRAQTGTVLHHRCDTAPCSQTAVTPAVLIWISVEPPKNDLPSLIINIQNNQINKKTMPGGKIADKNPRTVCRTRLQ